jgi:hypothetical protein
MKSGQEHPKRRLSKMTANVGWKFVNLTKTGPILLAVHSFRDKKFRKWHGLCFSIHSTPGGLTKWTPGKSNNLKMTGLKKRLLSGDD